MIRLKYIITRIVFRLIFCFDLDTDDRAGNDAETTLPESLDGKERIRSGFVSIMEENWPSISKISGESRDAWVDFTVRYSDLWSRVDRTALPFDYSKMVNNRGRHMDVKETHCPPWCPAEAKLSKEATTKTAWKKRKKKKLDLTSAENFWILSLTCKMCIVYIERNLSEFKSLLEFSSDNFFNGHQIWIEKF